MEVEDPCARRRFWQDFYDKVALMGGSDRNRQIIASFHDIWSEIRYDNVKGLRRLLPQLSQSQIAELIESFIVYIFPSSASTSWQVIHGSLLGIIVLMEPYFTKNDSAETEIVRNKILQSSVVLLAHMNLLVRESSRKCINTYINIGNFAYNNDFIITLLNNIYEKVLQDKNCNNEISANSLHGMLGCIIDYVKSNLLSIHHYKINGDITLLSSLNLCLSHKSSTVRLRSVEVISSLFAKLMTDKNMTEMGELLEFISTLINTSLESVSSWEIMESISLICEELMNNAVKNIIQYWLTLSDDMKLSTWLPDGTMTAFSAVHHCHGMYSLDAFRFLVSCLRNNLSAILMHSQFEVRRMACQLLPSLVRVSILLDYDLNMKIQYPEDARGTACGVENNLRSKALHNSVVYSWTSEVAKSVQHLLEVFELNSESSTVKSIEKDSDSAMVDPWVMKIKGRLSEEEMKILFNNSLKLLHSRGSSTLQQIVRHIMYKALTKLSELTNQIIAIETRMIQMCTQLDVTFVNVDYIEAICLIWCVFIPYKKQIHQVPSSWTPLFDIASVQMNNLEIALVYIINQLQKIQSQTQGSTDLVVSTLLEQSTSKCYGGVDNVFSFGSDVGVAVKSRSPPTSPTKKVYHEYNANDRLQIISSITDPNSAKVTDSGSSGILSLCCVDSIGCNRWICEAIAPLHPLITCSICTELTEYLTIDALSQYGRIIANWILNCTIDVLWLDRKLSAKKAMYDGLLNIVAAIMRFSSNYSNTSVKAVDSMCTEVGAPISSKRLINLSIDTNNGSINYKNTSINIERMLTILFHVITLQAGMGMGSLMDPIDAYKLIHSYNLLLTSTTFVNSPVNSNCSSYVYNRDLVQVILQRYKRKYEVNRSDVPASINHVIDHSSISTVSNGVDTTGSMDDNIEGSELDEAEFSDWDNDDNDELEGSAVSCDKKSVQSGSAHHNQEVNVKINLEIDEILKILRV